MGENKKEEDKKGGVKNIRVDATVNGSVDVDDMEEDNSDGDNSVGDNCGSEESDSDNEELMFVESLKNSIVESDSLNVLNKGDEVSKHNKTDGSMVIKVLDLNAEKDYIDDFPKFESQRKASANGDSTKRKTSSF